MAPRSSYVYYCGAVHLLAQSRHYRLRVMSAFEGKVDIPLILLRCPLLTHSGHCRVTWHIETNLHPKRAKVMCARFGELRRAFVIFI